jgi:hypothetical protein
MVAKSSSLLQIMAAFLTWCPMETALDKSSSSVLTMSNVKFMMTVSQRSAWTNQTVQWSHLQSRMPSPNLDTNTTPSHTRRHGLGTRARGGPRQRNYMILTHLYQNPVGYCNQLHPGSSWKSCMLQGCADVTCYERSVGLQAVPPSGRINVTATYIHDWLVWRPRRTSGAQGVRRCRFRGMRTCDAQYHWSGTCS